MIDLQKDSAGATMATKVLMSGSWDRSQHDGKTQVHMWSVGQQVTVQPRTWPGYVDR